MVYRYNNRQLARGRRLRGEITVAETMLWRCLRDRGIGAKFRRQVPIGPYVADFVCVPPKLVVELDGPPHENPQRRLDDAARDAWLRAEGWRVLRLSNELVIGGGNLVLEEIRRVIGTVRPSPLCTSSTLSDE
jgi:very-short-patch-repair endonuclease